MYDRFHTRNSDMEDKSSLEAAAEAAAKVNAMLIAKGMLRPNQIHSGTNVITKKGGGPNSLVVAEVEINNLTTPCRNTLTRGTTQEEISKASGAAVTTRGRYMVPDEKARNPRDRCLYLNVQAASKESVDIAVDKINEIIKSMCGNKNDNRGHVGQFGSGGRMRPPLRMNHRFPVRIPHNQPPPPLMSLPTPPPLHTQMPPPPQPAPHTVTVLQEKLYIGLEHAPPNFDTKNKLLGPGGSFLQHIQTETGAHVSLRGKGSGFGDLGGADTIEPMHVHIEHPSLVGLQEAKKLAENLIQTVQQSYVSFQQALAAMPASVPTGLMTGLPQQPTFLEPQLGHGQPPLATIAAVQEQPMQALPPQVQQVGPPTMLVPAGSVANSMPALPQAMANTAPGQPMVIPQSLSLTTMPLVNSMPVSAASIMQQQPPPMELAGQQQVLLSQQVSAPPPQHLTPVGMPQVVPAPQPVQQAVAAPMAAYSHVQSSVQLVSQAVSMAPPGMVQQPGPPILAQGPQHGILQAPPPQPVPSMSAPTSVMYTVASSNASLYYTTPKEADMVKRRFTEEKDDKIPENLLGYQHGPPHLVNLVRSSPPPQSVPAPISQGPQPPPPMAPQLVQGPPPGLIVSHLPPEQGQFAHHLGGQTIIQHAPQPLLAGPPPPEGQQILGPPPPGPPQFPPSMPPPPPPHQGLPSHHQGPPPPLHHQGLPPPPPHQGPPLPHQPPHPLPQHLLGPPPALSPSHQPSQSPGLESRPPSHGHCVVSSAALMPPPPPPTAVTAQSPIDMKRDEENRSMPPPKSPDVPWENSAKRKGSSPQHEPEKKKIRGILKNKQQGEPAQDGEKEEEAENNPEGEQEEEKPSHPASPQYQGQPLRYPAMASDPNLPPTSQESGIPHQHRPLLSAVPTSLAPMAGVPTSLPPGHHIMQQIDPSLPPQVHLAPQHLHLEAPPRLEGPPPTQIVVEHPGPHGAPIHITHHRVPAPAQIHIEHPVGGGPPRQVLMEHPPPQAIQIEHTAPPSLQPPAGHPEHLHHHPHAHVAGAQPPPSQEMYEFEAGAQQVPPAPPQYQNFEHVAVSQPNPSAGEQQLLAPPGSAVIVSSTQPFPQYSVAISSAAAPPPVAAASFALPTSAPPFSIHSQHMSPQPLQRLPEPQPPHHLTGPPPPPPPP
ncbi:proline-rich protein 36, partial [Aplysia californica]|uniref:KH homology domain-containing protein 4 n=1 Tax=Aplysia californica TaxID=6500 RepID=A0ABM1AFV9_APLCA